MQEINNCLRIDIINLSYKIYMTVGNVDINDDFLNFFSFKEKPDENEIKGLFRQCLEYI